MGRTKGATNKNKQPIELAMAEDERLNLLADIILETITAEQVEVEHVTPTS